MTHTVSRQPVRAQKKAWVAARTLRILGVDPGFAETGVAVLEQGEGVVAARAVDVLRTAKEAKKPGVTPMRRSYDDSRRVFEYGEALTDLIERWQPHVLCVEAFAPFPGKGGGNAWKTAIVYGATLAAAQHHNLLLLTGLPLDVKRAFSLAKGATKGAIGAAVCAVVPDLRALLEAVPKTRREHVTDAAAHAYIGFARVAEIRQMTGANL